MCKLFSCIIDRKGTVYVGCGGWETSHTEIEILNGLENDGEAEYQRAKFEVFPPCGRYRDPVDQWDVYLDSDSKDLLWVKESHFKKVREVFEAWWTQQLNPLMQIHKGLRIGASAWLSFHNRLNQNVFSLTPATILRITLWDRHDLNKHAINRPMNGRQYAVLYRVVDLVKKGFTYAGKQYK